MKAKLTRNQTFVYEALTRAKAPMSAYELLDRLQKKGFKAPPQVYRALDKLTGLGLVHRIEKLNAFVACNHSDDNHHGVSAMVVCNSCNCVVEFPADKVVNQLSALAKDQGFGLQSSTIELDGLCGSCKPSDS